MRKPFSFYLLLPEVVVYFKSEKCKECNCIDSGWIKYDNNACFKTHKFKVIINSKQIHVLNDDLTLESSKGKIADVVVYEWEEIWIKVESDQEVEKIYFGEKEAQEKLKGWWVYIFKNYLGKSFIRVKFKNGQEIKTDPIEVISSKFKADSKEEISTSLKNYSQFLQALIDGLIEHIVSAPFDIDSPTVFSTEEYGKPPSLIFILHVLASNAENIIQALQTIWKNPYRTLTTEERWVLLHEASNVCPDTIIMMLKHPEYLHKHSGKEFGLLTQRLKGYVPERVFEWQVIETLDNPENRFVKSFVDTIVYLCDELKRQDLWGKVGIYQAKLENLENFVRYFQADPLFADVGEMNIFPASSQVLLKRDGYRECLKVYRLLNLSQIPIFEQIQDAIENRRIDVLYEYWCFFELANLLAKVLAEVNGGKEAKPKFKIVENPEGGLGYEAKAELGYGYELIYNKTFKGYSVFLRPDFSLMKSRKLEVVFDAKFRFDLRENEDKKEEDINLEDKEEQALKEGNIKKLAKVEDIYKMHTYRDALQCRAAFVIYPGSEFKSYELKKNKNNQNEENNMREFMKKLILDDEWEGVGFIGLCPTDKKEKNE